MKTKTLSSFNKALIAGMVVAAFGLAGCQANGDGLESGDIVSDGGNTTPPLNNDGSTPTTVNEDDNGDGTAETPVDGGKGFVCTKGANAFGGATTEVVANGLVGGALSNLLNSLGGAPVTTLTNSVSEPDNVIDGKLSTFATFTLPVGLLGPLNLVDSVGEAVVFPSAVPAGNYAVFGVTFPAATVNLGLTRTVTVTTYLGDTQQETISVDEAQIQLLGLNAVGDEAGFIGLKARKKYDSAVISISALLVAADVGDAMRVHELCTDGKFVTPPTP
ncbi:hypothetical protein [Solimonas terrae]|uniref:Uncharacterized protein n=1 Tax=Solimonas terrae TaxID=1396819 RepID=A0A6M2BSU1_9GAMM|nr:hypothetical protein [Solimonas terrae]NGY05305.1 hypothetical protein [Solimonas terrae]